MTRYLCRLARPDGTRLAVHRSAPSETVLIRDLNAEGYLILGIEEVASGAISLARLKPASVLKFTEVLATLTSNGLSLKDALVLAQPLGGKDLGPFLASLVGKVEKGHSLHQALAEGPRGFSALYLGLVRIGEQTGDLATILPRLTDYLKSRRALWNKTINALVYPVFVLVVAVVGIVLLSLFVLPTLTETIGGVNPELARQYRDRVFEFQVLVAVVLGGVTIGGLGLGAFWRYLGKLWLSLPLVGTLIRQSFALHVAFAMEILLDSGYSVETALGESLAVVSNPMLRASWRNVRDGVVKGSTLSRALRKEGLYPETFIGWVEVGEMAHDLKRSFQQLRTFYQSQVEDQTARFTNLAEPTLIVVVGGMLVILVLTFITPIFTMLGRLF